MDINDEDWDDDDFCEFYITDKEAEEAKKEILKKILLLPGFKEENELYENVLAKNIKCNRNNGVYSESTEVIDIVICKGDAVKLCINFYNNDGDQLEKPTIKGIPHQLTVVLSEISRDGYESLIKYVESVMDSKSIERYVLPTVSIEATMQKFGMDEKEIRNIFIQENFLRKPIDKSENDTRSLITEYGIEHGLIKRCRLDEFEKLSYDFVIAQKVNEELNNVLLRKVPKYMKTKKKISFANRIQKLNMGLPGDNDYAVSLIKKSANLPIEAFFKEQPDKLKELESVIAEFDENVSFDTYEEVAYLINKMLMDGMNQQKGREAMMLLVTVFKNHIDKKCEGVKKTI